MKILYQGAEAILTRKGNVVVKERVSKKYRIKQIDERLRKQRTKEEVELLNRCRRIGLNVPQILSVSKFSFKMEYIKGEPLRDILNKDNYKNICSQLGKLVAKMHNNSIIHGDLTTSNMILKDDKIYFIDFGLGAISKKIEDKGTDLHLVKEALNSQHSDICEDCWKLFLKSYIEFCKDSKEILNRLKKIEQRGRYKCFVIRK